MIKTIFVANVSNDVMFVHVCIVYILYIISIFVQRPLILHLTLMHDDFIVQGHVTIVSIPLMQDDFIVQGHVNCYYC